MLLPTVSFHVIVRFQLFLLHLKAYEFLHTTKLIIYDILYAGIFYVAIQQIRILSFITLILDMAITFVTIELKLQ